MTSPAVRVGETVLPGSPPFAAMRGAHVQRVLFTHFQVPAVEMLFDEPLCCPIYGALTFDGLAADSQGRFHRVVRTAAARAYLGPEAATVARRAHILVTALVDGGLIGVDRVSGVAAWLGECWSAAAEESLSDTD